MDKEAILKKIKEFEEKIGWYHDIDLGEGIRTKTRSYWNEDADHPRRRFREIAPALPEDLTGMSVLDIGCNAGFMSLEAKRRGAETVLGIDYKQDYIDQARFCAEVKGVDIEYRLGDVYDLEKLGRRFDIVFFVGVLYHCHHFMRALEQVVKVTEKKVILETAIYRPKRWTLLGPKPMSEPLVLYVGNDDTKPGTWHPNISFLMTAFKDFGFPTVEKLFEIGGRGGIYAER